MKKAFFIIVLFSSSMIVNAKKLVYPLEVVAGMADLIVIGTIDKVNNKFYTLDISETIKGKDSLTIKVNMFNEWTCDKRFAKPVKGQQLFLFLKKEKNGWEIINGSTGELEIEQDSVANTFFYFFHIASENEIEKLSTNELKNIVTEFCKSYEFVGEYLDYPKSSFKQLLDNNQIETIVKNNKLVGILVENARRYNKLKQ